MKLRHLLTSAVCAPLIASGIASTAYAGEATDMSEQCYITAQVSQKRFSIDFTRHLKDAWNKKSIVIPTSCAKAETIKPGDTIFKKFRAGSLITEGTTSSWQIKATYVHTPANADRSACQAKLTLKEERFSLDFGKHMKDAMNKQKFDWPMPCSLYNDLNDKENLVKKPYRSGSILMKSSLSKWSLKINK